MQRKSSSTNLSANPAHGNNRETVDIQQDKRTKMSTGNQQDNRSQVAAMARHGRIGPVVAKWLVAALAILVQQHLVQAFHFNFQPEQPQASGHQSLSPQTYNGLNPNAFYQAPANQFVPGQRFFTNQPFSQTVQLKPQQQAGGAAQYLNQPTTTAPNVDVSDIAGQLNEPQRDFANSYTVDTAPAALTETSRIQSMNEVAASSSPSPPIDSTSTRAAGEQPTTSQSPTSAPATKRQQPPPVEPQAPVDLDVARSSPSPSGKILDVVGRDSSVVSVVSQSPSARDQPTQSSTTTTTTTTPTPTSTTTPIDPQRQVLKPAQHNAPAANKDPLRRAEQQIMDQHARASLSSGLRSEQSTMAPQHITLVPNSYRDGGNNGHRLVGSLLSLLNYNPQTAHADDSSLLKSSPGDSVGRQKTGDSSGGGGGFFGLLADSLKSGISSRTSIVKAAMGENKLARSKYHRGEAVGDLQSPSVCLTRHRHLVV